MYMKMGKHGQGWGCRRVGCVACWLCACNFGLSAISTYGLCPVHVHVHVFPQDMEVLRRRHAYSTVKLAVRFMRGLHPFFPPSVEVLRPHLRRACMQSTWCCTCFAVTWSCTAASECLDMPAGAGLSWAGSMLSSCS